MGVIFAPKQRAEEFLPQPQTEFCIHFWAKCHTHVVLLLSHTVFVKILPFLKVLPFLLRADYLWKCQVSAKLVVLVLPQACDVMMVPVATRSANMMNISSLKIILLVYIDPRFMPSDL